MKKNRLALNTWTGILDIVNCVLFLISWPVIFITAFSTSDGTAPYRIATFFYAIAWIGISLNIWALVQSKKHCISLVGSVLGIIGNVLFVLTATIAFLPYTSNFDCRSSVYYVTKTCQQYNSSKY